VLVDPRRAPTDALQTLFNGDITFGDKLRLFTLQRELAGRSPGEILNRGGTSTRAYLDRVGFSAKFVDNFAAPLYGGITLDRDLETDSLVFEYTFKMLSEGRIGVPAAGMGAIPDQLAKRAEMAGATIETEGTVSSVESSSSEAVLTVDGETVVADAAVVATDPPTARDLTDVGSIPTEARSCVTQYVARQSRTGLPTGKRLVLNTEESGPNQIAPLSAVAPEYSPSDATLYSATFLGEREESDEALFQSVRETMASWYPEANLADLELVATDRVPFAQFAQPPGFRAGLPAVDDPDGPVFSPATTQGGRRFRARWRAGGWQRTWPLKNWGGDETGRDGAGAVPTPDSARAAGVGVCVVRVVLAVEDARNVVQRSPAEEGESEERRSDERERHLRRSHVRASAAAAKIASGIDPDPCRTCPDSIRRNLQHPPELSQRREFEGLVSVPSRTIGRNASTFLTRGDMKSPAYIPLTLTPRTSRLNEGSIRTSAPR